MTRIVFRVYAAPLALLLMISSLGGCGGSDAPDKPKSGLVIGKITLDGAPLPNAQVSFSPESKVTSSGTTNSDGAYELTFGANRGAVVGEHVVRIVTKIPGVRQHDAQGQVVADTSPDRVPAKYNAESTLTATVKAGENTFNFDLLSK